MILVAQMAVFVNYDDYVPHFDFTELPEDLIRSRGNKYKLVQHICHYDLSKFNFTKQDRPGS